MNTEQRKDYLQSVYRKALGAGLCRTQTEWAKLLEIDRAGLSSAMNGNEKALTESLVKKVQMWAQINGIEQGAPQPETIEIPAATVSLYQNLTEAMKNMSETIRLQQELISRLQGAHIQKKIG